MEKILQPVKTDSWDPTLAEELGRALGEEAADQGVSVVLGPGLCIKRSAVDRKSVV